MDRSTPSGATKQKSTIDKVFMRIRIGLLILSNQDAWHHDDG